MIQNFCSKISKAILLLLIIALIPVASSKAQGGGTTAADFLLIGIGARAAGMGGAYTSLAQGAQATYWNPAGLSSLKNGEVTFGHFSWLQDITLEHGSIAYKLKEKTAVGFSVTYLNYGLIEGYDNLGNPTGEISAYDMVAAFSVGTEAFEGVTLGFTGKFITQKLDNLSGSTFAIDLGARYENDNFSVGAVLANFGQKMNFESVEENLPMSARLGVSGYLFDHRLLAALDLEKEVYGKTVIRNGFEYSHNGSYFLRSGFNLYHNDDLKGVGSGFSFGAGMSINQIQIDYAFTIADKIASEDTHRFSVMFQI